MKFVDVMGLEYSRSKCWLNCDLASAGALYLMTIGSFFWESAYGQVFLAGAAFIIQIVSLFFRRRSSDHFSLAERIRRIAMLEDGLGIEPSPEQKALILEKVGNPQDAKPLYQGPYYESKLSVGPPRLIAITQECAFFTASAARTTARYLWTGVLIGAVLAILSIVAFVPCTKNQLLLIAVSKIALITMTFWAAGDLVEMAFQFGNLVRSAEMIFNRSESLSADANVSRELAYELLTEYNCATLEAPPIPSWVYQSRVANLNKAWNHRHPAKRRKESESI